MKKILNITNGDCAMEVMKQAQLPGEFLPWRDVLHEGPVPDDISLEELSVIRAEYIASQDWLDSAAAKKSFAERDNALKSYTQYDKIILWFEHDLFDQLQLIQLLDWFRQNTNSNVALTMICVDQYLGPLKPDEMKSLTQYEEPVTEKQLDLAQHAWAAFRTETPERWFALLESDTSVLSFLESAITRMLEEYPSTKNGLSRTAQQALEIVSSGESRPGRVFGRTFELEERRFMGDSGFWNILHQLLESSPPLLVLPEGEELTLPTSPDQTLTITPTGKEVMCGKKNWLDVHIIDRWIGRVHLTPDNVWCWDSNKCKIVKQANN